MGLRNMKIPKMKFKKMKMEDAMNELGDIDYEKLAKKNLKQKRETPYEDMTHYKTVKEFFLNTVEKYPNEDCILEKPDHKTPYKITTYKEFKEDVFGLGTALTNVLNLKNKRVIIIGETQYGWYVSYMAMLCGVGIAVPTDRELPLNELENIIKRSQASAVIYSPKKSADIAKVKEDIPEVQYFIEMKGENKLEGKDVGLQYLIDLGKAIIKSGDSSFEKIEIDPEEFKILFFTSGTTSNAKGVMLNNRNLAENINAVTAYVKLYPFDMLFSVLPMHHCYESTIGFLLPMATGSAVAICEGLRYIVPDMQEAHPTAIIAVPLLIEALYKKINEKIVKSKKDKIVNTMIPITNTLKSAGIDIKRKVFKEIYDNLGGRLRIIVSAAAPIDPKAGKWLQDIGISFLQGYGLTETAPVVAVESRKNQKNGTVGMPLINETVEIINKDDNGIGEIRVKGQNVMLGYYDMQEETDSVLKKGWFYTGDLGYIDKDGFLVINGRSKNMIVLKNGKKVFPEELETLINRFDFVKENMVFGLPEDSNNIKLSVKVVYDEKVLNEKYNLNSKDKIRDFVWNNIKELNTKFPKYKHIKNLILTDEELIKTTTKKVKRNEEMKKILKNT